MKWDTKALKKKFVGFDGFTIYRVYIEDQNKVIKVKNLQILEDTSTKAFSTLSNFDGKPRFDARQIPDEQGLFNKSYTFKDEKTRPKPF